MRTFPSDSKTTEIKRIDTVIFGNRFHKDQTLYEYLIEFLLVFASAKSDDYKSHKMKFHDLTDPSQQSLEYYFNPNMGLRRFIFYDKSKKDNSISLDEDAYQELRMALKQMLYSDDDYEDYEDMIDGIQDLLYGYAVVLRNRAWCAQNVLPLCPELLFCGANPNKRERKKIEEMSKEIDKLFAFDKRNFLARGGEVYYLHLLQGFKENDPRKEELEYLLTNLLTRDSQKLSVLASQIQGTWEECLGVEEQDLICRLSCAFIPEDAYKDCESNSIDELITYLSNDISPIKRLDVLASGMMYQIMRMMYCAVVKTLQIEPRKWIVHIRNCQSDIVKTLAVNNYHDIENDFVEALSMVGNEYFKDELVKKINDSRKESLDIFKAKGKEIQAIIPPKGGNERFSLSENTVTFLVLSLIKPGEKMTYDMFLKKLYRHYGLIIGPDEYRKSVSKESDKNLANYFNDNSECFQILLRQLGFLRELSDATSIVVNPYESVRK